MLSFKEFSKLSESKYVVLHNTYSSAVNQIEKYVHQNSYELKEDEVWNKISIGPSKPNDGETNKFHLTLIKNDKEQKKVLHAQITGVGNKYELNMYIL